MDIDELKSDVKLLVKNYLIKHQNEYVKKIFNHIIKHFDENFEKEWNNIEDKSKEYYFNLKYSTSVHQLSSYIIDHIAP